MEPDKSSEANEVTPPGAARRVVNLSFDGVGAMGVHLVVNGVIGARATFSTTLTIPGPGDTETEVSTVIAVVLGPEDAIDEVDAALGEPQAGQNLARDFKHTGGE
jgi:hypothetical protein